MLFFYRSKTYENAITPYMHVFIYHTPYFLQKFGSLQHFSMDGVELMNRKHKLLFFNSTDHGRENTMSEQVYSILYHTVLQI